MTVIRPNSVAGINSITVASGEALSVHKSDGTLISTIVSSTGVGTFHSIEVGTAATISNNGNATFSGIVTAASFVGDGSGLTNAGPSLTGSTNNTVVTVTGANAIQGESNVQIDSSGRLLIGTTTEGHSNADDLTVATSGNTGITIRSGTSNGGNIFFSDATSGTGEYTGMISYDHNDNIMTFATSGGTERLRINSSGQVGIASATPRTGFKLDVNGDLTLGESGGTDNSFLDQKQNGDFHIINSGRASDGGSNTGGAGGIGINRYNTLAGGTTNFRDLTVYDGKNTKILVVDGSANAVGIGTDSPQDTLDVANTVPQIRFTDLSDGSYGQIRANGGNLILRADEGNTVGDSIINFEIDGDEKSRITSDGFFLIGTASAFTSVSYRKLQVGMADGGWVNLARTGTPSAGNHVGAIQGFTKSPDGNYHDTIGIDFKAESSASNTSKPMRMEFYTTPSSSTTKAERMRLDKDGTLFIGKANQSSGTAGVELYADGPNFMTRNGTTVLGLNNDAGTNGDIMRFYFQDVHKGNLNFSSGSFSATTASDYRLKENDTPITDGIARVKQLRPIRFNFKDNPSETLDGFFAHELQEVVPDCVTGEKDGEISERGEGYQCISKEGLVPLLTAALQEAITKIEDLETDVRELNLKVSALGGG